MKLDRLFNVLVLGGAAIGLGTACGEENVGGGAAGGGTGEGGATSSSSNATTSGGGGDGGAAAGTGGAGGVGGQTAGSGGAGGLECPEIPSPDAPCGCPCCWITDCLNTDAVCCATFCENTCC